MGRSPCWSHGRTKQPHGEQGAPEQVTPQHHTLLLLLLLQPQGDTSSPGESQEGDSRQAGAFTKPFLRYQSSSRDPGMLLQGLHVLLQGGTRLLLPLFQNSGLAERGLAVRSPSLPCLPFHNDPKACIPHTSQQLAQFVTI